MPKRAPRFLQRALCFWHDAISHAASALPLESADLSRYHSCYRPEKAGEDYAIEEATSCRREIARDYAQNLQNCTVFKLDRGDQAIESDDARVIDIEQVAAPADNRRFEPFELTEFTPPRMVLFRSRGFGWLEEQNFSRLLTILGTRLRRPPTPFWMENYASQGRNGEWRSLSAKRLLSQGSSH